MTGFHIFWATIFFDCDTAGQSSVTDYSRTAQYLIVQAFQKNLFMAHKLL